MNNPYNILFLAGTGTAGSFGTTCLVLYKLTHLNNSEHTCDPYIPIKDSTWAKDAGWEVSEPQHISGQIFDWFVSKGGAEVFFKVVKPVGNARSAISESRRTEKYKDLPEPSIGPCRGGSFIVDKMVECCQKRGIQILYETPARKFITDNTGKVTGVLADTKEGQLLVNCKACVIAAGGFGRNYEKLQKHWPEEYNNKLPRRKRTG